MPKFSICAIVKDESNTLPRLLKSLEDFKANGGEVVCLDTGSTDKTIQIAKDWGCKVGEAGDKFLHEIDEELIAKINERFVVSGEEPIVKLGDKYFDFASARNEVASMASNDFVCFVDADEVLTKLDFNAIDKLIDEGIEQFEYNFVFAHDFYGKPAIEFVQSKFYNKQKLKWLGIVHEYLSGEAKKGFLLNEIFRLEHFQEPHPRHSYLVGLAVDCFNNPKNDRNSHYLAREMFWLNRPKSAIKEFERHITMGGWYSERAESMLFMGDAYGQLNEPDKQAEWYFKAFYTDSNRREPLMKLARFMLHNKNYQAAASYAKGAMEIPWNGFYASNKAFYEQEPYEILYNSYGWLGRIPEAQQAITKALEFQPQNPTYLRDSEYYFGPKNPDDYVDKGIEGWMTPTDLKWLHKTAKNAETFVEVGSWAGRSTDAILSGSKGKVWAIDTWKGAKDVFDSTNSMAKERDMLEVFKKNVGHYPNLNIVVKPSVEAAKDFADKSIDVIFIDAGHTYEEVLQDIDAWLPKVKDNGILCGHDYLPDTWMGVVKAVDERFGKPDEVVDWIWVIDFKKRNNDIGTNEIWKKLEEPEVTISDLPSAGIPKKLWTAWFGGEMPAVVAKSIESQRACALQFGYKHTVIDETFVEMLDVPDYVKIAIKNKKWVKATDYLRAWILYKFGGVFLDADMEILPRKNFDDLLHMELFAAKEENGFVGYSLVGSKPNHPLWEEYFKQVNEKFTPLDGKNFESSMEIFTHLMYSGKYQVVILFPEFFFPYNHQTGIIKVTENTRTFHHFMKSWTDISPDKLPVVSIIIPQLGRPDGLSRCLNSIDKLYYPKHLIEVLIEEGDDTVPVKVKRAFERSKGTHIIFGSNDIEFEPYSIYRAVVASKDKGLVAFNTSEPPTEGTRCEHFLIRRDLIEKIGGEIFDTRYFHVGVDQLLWAKCDKIKEAIWLKDAIVKHYHFSRGSKFDGIYAKGWEADNVQYDRDLLKQDLEKLYVS